MPLNWRHASTVFAQERTEEGFIMEQVLISLVDSFREQALAITGIADQVCALKATLLKHYPEMKEDFDAQLVVEKEGSRDYVSHIHAQLAQLRAAILRSCNCGFDQVSRYWIFLGACKQEPSDGNHRRACVSAGRMRTP